MFLDILGFLGACILIVMGVCVAGMLAAIPFMMIDMLFDLDLAEKVVTRSNKMWNGMPIAKRRKAFQQGYIDMSKGLSHDGRRWVSMFDRDFTFKGKGPWINESDLRRIAERKEHVREFNPADGRTSVEYMRGDGKLWNEYHRGGMKFLADVDDMQAKIMEEDRIVAIRETGISAIDRQYQASKRELDRLRDKTFAKIDDHRAFQDAMKESDAS